MSERKSPIEQALDLFVYAPIGLLLEAQEMIPRLAESGRNQVAQARTMGEFAIQTGQSELPKTVGKLQEQVTGVVAGLMGGGAMRASTTAADKPAPAPEPEPSAEPAEPPVAVESLAIPDYDSLSASQVVPRLAGLEGEELESVRLYEEAKRGRKTILNKIAQLQSA